tara:strand:+ start:6360 stop:6704 length:345 start_codon:yes stop_codon:yes gene_type:complete
MSSLDVVKNFAIVSLGKDTNQTIIYGVVFAALRTNPDLLLIITTNSKGVLTQVETHKNNVTFIHYSKWEQLFENEKIVNAFKHAYTSTPEDWPCGFVRTYFTTEQPKTQPTVEV